MFLKKEKQMNKLKKGVKSLYDVLPKHRKILDTGYNRMPHYVFDEEEA